MLKIPIKALSVNALYRGRRYRTEAYNKYEQEIWYMLPNKNIPQGKLAVKLEVGFSNKRADLDNVNKSFWDICQKKYSFNDSQIYKIEMEKKIVKKGEEYISFEINKY